MARETDRCIRLYRCARHTQTKCITQSLRWLKGKVRRLTMTYLTRLRTSLLTGPSQGLCSVNNTS